MSEQLLHLPEQGKAESLIHNDKDDNYFQMKLQAVICLHC